MSVAELPSSFSWINPVFETKTHPKFGNAGLFAKQDLPKGTPVVFWSGRFVSEAELKSLSEEEDCYSLQIDENIYQIPILPNRRENADFINHSCDPNAGFSGQVSLALMKDVKEGEEITFDYAMSESNEEHGEFECQCGASNCRKLFSGADWKRKELQERYDGYFSPYLAKRIAKLQKQEQQ